MSNNTNTEATNEFGMTTDEVDAALVETKNSRIKGIFSKTTDSMVKATKATGHGIAVASKRTYNASPAGMVNATVTGSKAIARKAKTTKDIVKLAKQVRNVRIVLANQGIEIADDTQE